MTLGETCCLCRTLRQEVYTAYETRASSGSSNNSPIVEQIMSLRQEQARLAGYDNAAKYLMSNKVLALMTATLELAKDPSEHHLCSTQPYMPCTGM